MPGSLQNLRKGVPVNRVVYSIIFWVFILSLSSFGWAEEKKEEYKFDLSEIEKKPYHLGGYAEIRPVLFGLDQNAALYKLRFYNRDEGGRMEEYNFRLQLEGSYEEGIARIFTRGT